MPNVTSVAKVSSISSNIIQFPYLLYFSIICLLKPFLLYIFIEKYYLPLRFYNTNKKETSVA